MELSRTEQGDFFANQCSYLREVVRRHGMEDLCSAQIMKESQEPEDELDRTPLQVREARQLKVNFYGWRRRQGLTLPIPSAGSAQRRAARQNGQSRRPTSSSGT